MLDVSNLNVRYGMHEALSAVSLTVSRDEIVVILGANGAGKSTLLSAIAGNCVGEVDGRVVLDGESLLGRDAAQIVEQGIAFVPEGRGVFADLSVEENLQLGSYSEHARSTEQKNLREVLSLFPKLDERKKQIVRTMSGGEQQMVAIGRALMSAPKILMLDEPSLGLSPLLCKELFSSLKTVRDSGVGILLVEQNAKQSLSISDRGYLLGNGKILGEDSAANLLNDSAVQAAYLGGAMASQNTTPGVKAGKTKPVVHIISPPEEGTRTTEAAVAELSFTPDNNGQSARTVSADSLLEEDVDALVARAGSNASRQRGSESYKSDASLPIQVVKLSTNKPSPTRTTTSATAGTSAVNALPQTQDKEVQALLADFEAAAKRAAAGSSSETSDDQSKSLRPSRDEQQDDPALLPHIPVYKKNPVSVYRRDGSRKLRKQDKPA